MNEKVKTKPAGRSDYYTVEVNMVKKLWLGVLSAEYKTAWNPTYLL